ncbi:hypothetical protein NP233_g11017 [Leucocoprinus birnbaumii]|uniref:Aldehyde dehydrogenase n=1 Tax=Leucocoprinus birnbaumii TaxID=56174 RepID=A0AAD5VHN4_9AGAR|nr:hypothetical protein NP233_g11017 [Leucocoprinus birnbaumii]
MAELEYTSLEGIEQIHKNLRAGFHSGKSKDVKYRKYQLLQLAYMIQDNTERFREALAADLGRPPFESQFLEIGSSIMEARTAWAGVHKWAKPEKPPLSMISTPLHSVIYKEPKGVVLIISPFNYPVWTSMCPLVRLSLAQNGSLSTHGLCLMLSNQVGAIAAGNAVVLKPSENAPHVASLLTELIPKYLDPELVAVVNGVLYTGSGRVGRIVGVAAAKQLTPVSLELGGKSPVFIDPNCDLEVAAKRIMWGKVVNAGQTCVAPDYVLVPIDFQEKFVNALKDACDEFYPESTSTPGAYSRLITPQAFKRVKGLLDDTKGKIVFGGETDEKQKFIAPTVVKDVAFNDSLMSEEIFGPILPVIPVKDVEEAIKFVNDNDHPLAFSMIQSYPVFTRTQSGAAVANDVLLHPGIEGLPFGGVGPSGSGYYTAGRSAPLNSEEIPANCDLFQD